MLSFSVPKIADRNEVEPLLKMSGSFGNEFCFGNIYIWKDVYSTKIARLDDMLLIHYGYESCMNFSFPAGNVNIEKAVDAMLSTRGDCMKELTILGCTPEGFEQLERVMPGAFGYELQRGKYDYVYSLSDLSELGGRKYHGKRNHIAAFEKENTDWRFEEINIDNIGYCYDMNAEWLEEKGADDSGVNEEALAVKKALDNFYSLGFVGGVISAGGRVVAYTIGEMLTDQIFCTHIEKAFHEIRGAYPIINREFSRLLLSKGYSLVNREEDTGSEALRKAKLSYHPVQLVEKGRAFYKGG